MSEKLILRKEIQLPDDLRALLHGPPPDGVWHLPSHPWIGNPFRFATKATLVPLTLLIALLLWTLFDSWSIGRFRSEAFFITLFPALFMAGVYWVCRRARAKAERLEADVQAGRARFGVWLTAQHVLVRDYDEGIRCTRREDIEKTHVYQSGRPRIELLVLTLRNKQPIRILVNAPDGRLGKAERLREEFDARLRTPQGMEAGEVQRMADLCLPKQNFREFARWLDGESKRLKFGERENSALLTMADTALASWPDSARDAFDEWSMRTEVNSVYEYGGSQSASDKNYLGFLKEQRFWLLPLCRTVYFFEAERIFPNVASVHDCAATFQNVPLTMIQFTGGMEPDVFDAFLAWAATKPLTALKARDYSTERNEVSNLREFLKQRLTEFKKERHVP